MTDKNYTHISVVLDRSGSMATIAKDMEGGLNEVFKEQAELPGECLVDLHQFDNRYDTVYQDRPVSKAKVNLVPRGTTALMDAIGKTVTTLGEKLKSMHEDDRPGTVIVIVVTDGMENASREWDAQAVKDLVKNQTSQWGWNFTFLGANIDAVQVGRTFGFNPDQSLTYAASKGGTRSMASSLNAYTTNTRSGLANAYTDEDRKNAEAGTSK